MFVDPVDDSENLNPEDVHQSLRSTANAIQNYTFDSAVSSGVTAAAAAAAASKTFDSSSSASSLSKGTTEGDSAVDGGLPEGQPPFLTILKDICEMASIVFLNRTPYFSFF